MTLDTKAFWAANSHLTGNALMRKPLVTSSEISHALRGLAELLREAADNADTAAQEQDDGYDFGMAMHAVDEAVMEARRVIDEDFEGHF